MNRIQYMYNIDRLLLINTNKAIKEEGGAWEVGRRRNKEEEIKTK